MVFNGGTSLGNSTSQGSSLGGLYSPPVNNFGLDPLQGFDFEVWVQDTYTGGVAWFGKFQSLTVSFRDATETYLELGQRLPIYLNGEIQIAWVLEQGLVDMAFVQRTFGVSVMARNQLLARGPRFHICFDSYAADLVREENNNNPRNTSDLVGRMGGAENSIFNRSNQLFPKENRKAQGRYELVRCKVDSVSAGFMPGRRVVGVRWEGVCEGYIYVDQTLQEFKKETRGGSVRTPNSYGSANLVRNYT